ncbi:hypothetical protein [Cryptosporangium sp. NPDC051539]|uniref:hypothetical protein n=1 Tax=Cryptosporangium sp. NPDC051539 TaxID=3363962 RepID=UPI003791E097
MARNEISVNLTGAIVLSAGVAQPRTDRKSGEQLIDRETGAPLYRVQMLVIQAAGAQLADVTVPNAAGLPVAAPLRVEGMRINQYEFDGRSGISWRADSVEAIGGACVDENGNPTVPVRGSQKQAS